MRASAAGPAATAPRELMFVTTGFGRSWKVVMIPQFVVFDVTHTGDRVSCDCMEDFMGKKRKSKAQGKAAAKAKQEKKQPKKGRK